MSSELFTHEPPPIGTPSLSSLMEPQYEPVEKLTTRSPETCLVARFNRHISGSDIFQCINLSLRQETNPNGVNLILDIQASNLSEMPARNMLELAEGLAFWLEQKGYANTKVAFVTTDQQHHSIKTASQQFSSTSLPAVRIYSNTEDAVQWFESVSL